MSTATTTKLMTAEEFCDWVHRPENDNKWFELVRGEVIELPPPTKPHGVVCRNVSPLLWHTSCSGGKAMSPATTPASSSNATRTRFAARMSPFTRTPTRSRNCTRKYGEVPPRLAVEVLSPNDRASKVMRKINDYLRLRRRPGLVIDPEIAQRDRLPTGQDA